MVQTDQQFPSVGSQTKGLLVNADGSVDVYFGPTAPPGKETNWIQTVPGKGWNTILRLYGPLEPWFDKTWRPGEIELAAVIGRRAGPRPHRSRRPAPNLPSARLAVTSRGRRTAG